MFFIKTEQQELVEDLVQIITVFSCKLQGKRANKARKLVKELISQANGKKSIGIIIGPEGGFEKEEIEQLKAAGGQTMSLGKRILRTETAGMTVLSILMFTIEE